MYSKQDDLPFADTKAWPATDVSKSREIRVSADLILKSTPVFDTYWKFAFKRQGLFMRRIAGKNPPWTDDPIIDTHRFTNVYRASDRVSQFLIRHVLYEGKQTGAEVFFRCVLFKLFNRIETWLELTARLGPLTWSSFNFEKYAKVLDVVSQTQSIYSAAYIMPSPNFGDPRKHRNHLRLLEFMMKDRAPQKVESAASLQDVFAVLRNYPSLGDFLAFQYAIDINYSAMIGFSEMDFVVAGPGACAGIRKCFTKTDPRKFSSIIRAIADLAPEEFARLGLPFQDLWGRPMQLIDCQNVFCEVDKYSRVAHPQFNEPFGRTRIKQRFAARSISLPQWYPPKWKIVLPPEICA